MKLFYKRFFFGNPQISTLRTFLKKLQMVSVVNVSFLKAFCYNPVREDTHKKSIFLVVGPLRFTLPTLMASLIRSKQKDFIQNQAILF